MSNPITTLSLVFSLTQLLYVASCNAHPLDFLFPKAEFKAYMQTPLRQKLLDSLNNGMHQPNPKDASNWTSCQVGKGQLVGTFRDISACAASACYQRAVSIEELANFSYEQAEGVIRWIWDKIHADKIPDQAIANLYMHIQMHYGNLRVVEKALVKMGYPLKVDGRIYRQEQKYLIEISKIAPFYTYNQIRAALAEAYAGDRPQYRKAFFRYLNKEFPPQSIFKHSLEQNLWISLRSAIYLGYQSWTHWKNIT